MKFPLTYEATTTRADFLRILPLATGEAELREIDGRLCGRGWAIRLTPIAPLEIGLVRLERHRVEIEFDGLTMRRAGALHAAIQPALPARWWLNSHI
jgi:hypothetical protein